MSTWERAVSALCIQEVWREATETADRLAVRSIPRLRQGMCRDAFAKEWTIARLAWQEREAEQIVNLELRRAFQQAIREAVNTYDGFGEVRFVDYSLLAHEADLPAPQSWHQPRTPASLFVAGFSDRLCRLPRRWGLFSAPALCPNEQVEIMAAVNPCFWLTQSNLETHLTRLRSQVTDELIAVF